MKKFCCQLAIIFYLSLGLTLPGCSRHTQAQSAELVTLHQGNLKIKDHPEAPKIVYVDARNAETHAPHLRAHLGKELAASKFRLADSPSKAGYILHVNILKDGPVDTTALTQAVQAGYGKNTQTTGTGGNAMLVDALMVQRRIPKAQRPSHQKMKNISSRNALNSSQMRLAVLSPGVKDTLNTEAFSQAIAKELALRMVKGE